MFKVLIGLVIVMSLTACGKDIHYVDRVVTETVEVPATKVPEIDKVVSEENIYRTAVGQPLLSKGLKCSIYKPSGTPASIAAASLGSAQVTYTYEGTFNQLDSSASTGLNIIPEGLRGLYTSWFVVRCEGVLIITETKNFTFDLASDDGSVLYLDGSKLIDNDGNHAVVNKSALKLLRRGVHSFRLDYMQGPAGNQALILKMNGELVSSQVLYR